MPRYLLDNYLDGADYWDDLAEDVRRGLTASPKFLLPKYFYDATGSDLFERITELPEYYPMKAEAALLRSIAPQLMASLCPDEVLELGSGSSTKSRILLDAQPPDRPLRRYLPLDVSESIVREAADALLQDYPGLEVHGIIADFEKHLSLLPSAEGRRLVLFLGGTIGNLHEAERVNLLRAIGSLLHEDDRLLLGIDLVKDVTVIERAYNDSAGVTAAFNRNILEVINKRLDADFRPLAFGHVAFFNRGMSRIEMHLRPETRQTATIRKLELGVEVGPDETIWTESSYKFTRASASRMLEAAGLRLDRWFSGEQAMFALVLAAPASGAGEGGSA